MWVIIELKGEREKKSNRDVLQRSATQRTTEGEKHSSGCVSDITQKLSEKKESEV